VQVTTEKNAAFSNNAHVCKVMLLQKGIGLS